MIHALLLNHQFILEPYLCELMIKFAEICCTKTIPPAITDCRFSSTQVGSTSHLSILKSLSVRKLLTVAFLCLLFLTFAHLFLPYWV